MVESLMWLQRQNSWWATQLRVSICYLCWIVFFAITTLEPVSYDTVGRFSKINPSFPLTFTVIIPFFRFCNFHKLCYLCFLFFCFRYCNIYIFATQIAHNYTSISINLNNFRIIQKEHPHILNTKFENIHYQHYQYWYQCL